MTAKSQTTQHYDLQGKTALVTGSTNGIGLGIAQALARAGARVVLHGLGNTEQIAAARAGVAAHGVDVTFHGADLADPDAIEAMVAHGQSFAQGFTNGSGGIDILINNAGIQHVAPVHEFPPERWDAILAINLSSVFHATRLCLPAMLANGWGRVINIASTHGLVASVNKSAYVAAKHGVVGLTKAVALETAASGVTVNAIAPGWVLTALVQQQIDAKAAALGLTAEAAAQQLLGEKQPSLQFTTPEQLGELALFLCSSAAVNVRGAVWNMDGGWVAQ